MLLIFVARTNYENYSPIYRSARMRTRVTVLFVCLSVTSLSHGLLSHLYDKLDLPTSSSLLFLRFQLTDFDKSVSFKRQSAFVVSSRYERLCILYLWL